MCMAEMLAHLLELLLLLLLLDDDEELDEEDLEDEEDDDELDEELDDDQLKLMTSGPSFGGTASTASTVKLTAAPREMMFFSSLRTAAKLTSF
jgi:hypothetical protein